MVVEENGQVKNEEGKVAIRRFPPYPQLVHVPGASYLFDVRNAVAIAWVNPEHVGIILSMMHTCCGGRTARQYYLADINAVKVWLGRNII